ncbi:UNVERIFIED_CONTAM: TkR86C [Trichonephila clavipes]
MLKIFIHSELINSSKANRVWSNRIKMGNTQQKEVDLLEVYMDSQEPVFNSNASGCEEIVKTIYNSSVMEDTLKFKSDVPTLNYSEVYSRCFNSSIPSNIFNQPYLLPWYQQLLWTLLFAVMILVAIVGNLIVIWIILAHRRMRTVTNLFLLNLAIADFLLASGNATFNFIFMLNSHWPFGGTFCVISNFVASLTVSTSVFTILAMSLDSVFDDYLYTFLQLNLNKLKIEKRCQSIDIVFTGTSYRDDSLLITNRLHDFLTNN